jgi:acyl carrier protein
VNVIVAIESEFDVSFTAEEVFELNTMRKLLDALEGYTAGR